MMAARLRFRTTRNQVRVCSGRPFEPPKGAGSYSSGAEPEYRRRGYLASSPPQGPATPGLAAARYGDNGWYPTVSGLAPELYDPAPAGLSEQTLKKPDDTNGSWERGSVQVGGGQNSCRLTNASSTDLPKKGALPAADRPLDRLLASLRDDSTSWPKTATTRSARTVRRPVDDHTSPFHSAFPLTRGFGTCSIQLAESGAIGSTTRIAPIWETPGGPSARRERGVQR